MELYSKYIKAPKDGYKTFRFGTLQEPKNVKVYVQGIRQFHPDDYTVESGIGFIEVTLTVPAEINTLIVVDYHEGH